MDRQPTRMETALYGVVCICLSAAFGWAIYNIVMAVSALPFDPH